MTAVQRPSTIEEFVNYILSKTKLTVAEISGWMQELEWDERWLQACQPMPLPVGTYGRTVIAAASHFELAVITWPAGQCSEIHDHGIAGTLGAVLVLQGQLFNHVYNIHDGIPQKGDASILPHGQIIEIPLGLIHQMGNASQTEMAMSLHLYTPPIIEHQCWAPNAESIAVATFVG